MSYFEKSEFQSSSQQENRGKIVKIEKSWTKHHLTIFLKDTCVFMMFTVQDTRQEYHNLSKKSNVIICLFFLENPTLILSGKEPRNSQKYKMAFLAPTQASPTIFIPWQIDSFKIHVS